MLHLHASSQHAGQARSAAIGIAGLWQVARRVTLVLWYRAEKSFSGGSNMKHLCFRLGLVTLLGCGMIAVCSLSAVAQDAAGTYKAKCAMCHGPDGKGSPMGVKMGVHDFTSADVQKETDAQLTDIITKGKAKMPSYDGKLKDAEIKDMVGFIRGLAKK
jgi:cytochrome c6